LVDDTSVTDTAVIVVGGVVTHILKLQSFVIILPDCLQVHPLWQLEVDDSERATSKFREQAVPVGLRKYGSGQYNWQGTPLQVAA
jgi:hypothetical protein